MGIFDFLKKGSTPPPAPGKASGNKKIAGHAKVVADKRAQTYDRQEAIAALVDIGGVEAAEALLKRFTFTIDPSITDQDEKESAFNGIVKVGKEAAPAVVLFCKRAEILTWPIRILRSVLSDAEYTEELLELADSFDTEYARNVEPKLQVINALADVKGDDVVKSVERFLDDVNESVRFSAVQTLFAQGNTASVEPLVTLLEAEESVRVKNKVCDGFVSAGWVVPKTLLERAQKATRELDDYVVNGDGKVTREGGFSIA